MEVPKVALEIKKSAESTGKRQEGKGRRLELVPRKPDLKDGHNGPKERVKVLAVRDGVAALRAEAEFTAKQVHSKDTRGQRRNNKPQESEQRAL